MTMIQTTIKGRKLITALAISGFLLSVFAAQILAQTTATSSANQTDDSQNSAAFSALSASRRETKSEERIKKLASAADRLIEVRLRALNRLQDRVSKVKNINEPDRQSLLEDINQNSEGLTSLKSKIDADTDLITLRADTKSIFTTYRIFMVVLPRDYGLLLTYREQYLVNRLTNLEDKIQAKIDEAKAKNLDTIQIEKTFADFKKKVASANSALTTAESKFSSMKPADTTGAAVLREAGKSALKAATADIRGARNDLENIIKDLKNLRKKEASSSSGTTTP